MVLVEKRYVALARVSSREQEREGFSLDVQVDALRQYAERNNGEIVRLFRIAETASKYDERSTFKELMAFAKENLTGYKRPKHIEFRDELPKTNVGKILRRELRG